jgi:AraC-like DNA-binding protein/quercetin dioxygenase-like cupin family protein
MEPMSTVEPDDGVTRGVALRELRIHDLVLTEITHARGTMLPAHSHAPATLVVVVSGSFVETIGGVPVDCRAGSVLYKPAATSHSNDYVTDVRSIAVELPPDRGAERPIILNGPALRASVGALQRELRERAYAWEVAAEGLVLEILARVMRSGLRVGGMQPEWVRNLEELLRSGEVDSLHDAAVRLHRAPAQVARNFRRWTGRTIGEFTRLCRVEAAARELVTTTKSIARIAVENGFYDPSHFTRVFRRVMKVTPSQYRAMQS